MKKKGILFTAVVMAAAFFAVSCATTSQKINPQWPSFVLNPPENPALIYGTGAYKMSSEADQGVALSISENRARVSITQKISSIVENMITDFSSGNEGDEIKKYTESISRTLARAQLSGTKVEKREVVGNTLWVLLSMPAEAAKQAAVKAVAENPNKKFSQDAEKRMDEAFSKADKATIPVEN
ncbi:MAG: hypothetical protein LBC53_01040 [Spirochaetaceae bacterium]|nr:hypothetical protein [Spirochaetaceae bacterium]